MVLFIHHWFNLEFRFTVGISHLGLMWFCKNKYMYSVFSCHQNWLAEKDLKGTAKKKHLIWRDRYLLIKAMAEWKSYAWFSTKQQTKQHLSSCKKPRKEKDVFGWSVLPKAYFFQQFVCCQTTEASRLSGLVSLSFLQILSGLAEILKVCL